jgi:hypothetical protein
MVNRSIVAALAVLAWFALGGEAQAQCSGQPNANSVCAGPSSGGAGLPVFRPLVSADMPTPLSAPIVVNTTVITGGTNLSLPYNKAGVYGEFVMGGDCTLGSGTFPNINCTKTGGTTFAPSATTDATNASNISTGTLLGARIDTATAANFRAGATGKVLIADQVYTSEVAITFSATPTFDFSTFLNASITLTANITSITFSNMKAGQAGLLRFIQDGTGGRTIPPTVNANLKCAGGCNYVLSTAASAVDVIGYTCLATNYCVGGALLANVK